MERKIVGKFCERKLAAKTRFDRRSFRWKRSGRAWLLIGCPKGKWRPRLERCAVGTRAYVVLAAPKGATCCPHHRPKERCIVKR